MTKRQRPDESDLGAYYDARADHFDETYQRDDPTEKAELAMITAQLKEAFAGRRVLEVAAGTGWWTAVIAPVAKFVLATDVAPRMLEFAHRRGLPPDRVEFRFVDAFALDTVEPGFDGGLANFWLSHVHRRDIARFLRLLHAPLQDGATVFLADNVYVEGKGGQLLAPPGAEDTYRLRALPDGKRYTVLKNYFRREELESIFTPCARRMTLHMGGAYWWLHYTLRKQAPVSA